MESLLLAGLVSLVVGLATYVITSRTSGKCKVNDTTCKERQQSCGNLFTVKIDGLKGEVARVATALEKLAENTSAAVYREYGNPDKTPKR